MTAKPRPFWKMSEILPPLGIPVLVIWGGRGPFESARVARPRTGRQAWATRDGWQTFLLPLERGERDPLHEPGKPWLGWRHLEGDPEFWSPKNPERWEVPMPPPAFVWDDSAEARMWTERQSFDAVAAAEEMEADREAARAGEGKGEGRRQLWWMDPTQVTYSPPGKITRREAEGRMMRHLAGWGAGSVAIGLGMHSVSVLDFGLSDDDIRTLAESEAQTPPSFQRFERQKQDRDDEAAPEWFAALGFDRAGNQRCFGNGTWSPAQRVLVILADPRGLGLSQIAEAMEVSRQRVHQLAGDALERVWVIANGFHDAGVAARAAAVADLKSRNRRNSETRGNL